MLYKLAAARLKNGFCTKKSFVDKLRDVGFDINEQTYNRMESGKQKVDVKTAIFIADFFKTTVKALFFDDESSKTEPEQIA